MKTKRIWKENVSLFIQLCKDSKLKYVCNGPYKDLDGDELFEIKFSGNLPLKSWDHYHKHRIKK